MKLENLNFKHQILKLKASGFSLIEVLVAVAIFSLVMVAGTGAVLSIIDANQKSQGLNAVMTNLDIAFEGMSKNIRTGVNYQCIDSAGGLLGFDVTTHECSGGGIRFVPSDATNAIDRVEYRWESNIVTGATSIRKYVLSGGNTTQADITAPEIRIDSLNFRVYGGVTTIQPRVLIVVSGTGALATGLESSFSLQTTVSQRLLEE